MSDDELEQRVAAEIRTFYTDRGGPYLDAARSVIALCREDIAAEIDAVTIEAPLSGDPMPGCPGCGPYSDHCCGQSADYERALRERIATEIETLATEAVRGRPGYAVGNATFNEGIERAARLVRRGEQE